MTWPTYASAQPAARQVRQSVVSYQVVWREPVRDAFGAPTGKFRRTSETFDTERKAKAHLRQVENALDSARGVDPSSAEGQGQYAVGNLRASVPRQPCGPIDPTTIEGYEKLYRTHIAPVFGSKPVASITTADVARFRAALLAPHKRRQVTRGKPDPERKVVRTGQQVPLAQDGEAHCRNAQAHTGHRPGRSGHASQPCGSGRPQAHHETPSCVRWRAFQAPSADGQPSSLCSDWIASNVQGQGNDHLRAGCHCSQRIPAFGPLSCRAYRCRTSRCPPYPAPLALSGCAHSQARRPASGPTGTPKI